MRLPHYLKPEHTIKEIDGGTHPIPRKRLSTKYVVKYDEKNYPPKYLICRAHYFYDKKEFPNIFGGGPEANNYLIARGFKVWNWKTGEPVGIEAEDEAEQSTFPEGRKALKTHWSRERDTRIAKAAKNKRLRETGDLACDACGFSFSQRYGNLGVGYIEAHHTVPISEIGGSRKTEIEEIALVCSNCHRMLHSGRPWMPIDQLRGNLE